MMDYSGYGGRDNVAKMPDLAAWWSKQFGGCYVQIWVRGLCMASHGKQHEEKL